MTRRIPLLVVLLMGLGACRSQIQHGLDERDANEILSVLVARGFDAKKVPEKGKKPTWAIELPDDRSADALRILTELKLPRPARTTTRDVAQTAGLIDTPSAEKLRQLEALEGDIEQTLETMDGVVSAGVELVVPLPPRPGVPSSPSKASALVRVHPQSFERIQQQREQIKGLIAGSVEGLKSDDVSLMVDPVESHVAAEPALERTESSQRLRVVVLVLACLLMLVASALVVVALYLRRKTKGLASPPKATAAEAPTTPAKASGTPGRTPTPPLTAKPAIAASAQRKVA